MLPSADHTSSKRVGLTLIEVVVSTVIVALILTSSLQTVATAVSIRNRTTEMQMGPALARDLLNEILQKPYADPDVPSSSIGTEIGEGGGNRSRFDDVDDYHGWNRVNPVNPGGGQIPLSIGWRRSVIVEFIDPTALTPTASDLGLKKIVVTATPPSGAATVIEALRSTLGANERKPHADRTIVAGATVAIELTDGLASEYSSTFSRNQAADE